MASKFKKMAMQLINEHKNSPEVKLAESYSDNEAFRAGANQITGLSKQRTEGLMAKFAATGTGRTGIGGAAFNEVSNSTGNSLTTLAGEESNRRSQILEKLIGIKQYNQQREDSDTDFWDVLGSGLGMLAGSALGPVGAALGSGLGNKLTGLLGGGGDTSGYTPDYKKIYG